MPLGLLVEAWHLLEAHPGLGLFQVWACTLQAQASLWAHLVAVATAPAFVFFIWRMTTIDDDDDDDNDDDDVDDDDE